MSGLELHVGRVEPRDDGELKACCASFYEHDLVALVLGDSYHPGGRALTRRLGERLRLGPDDRVLDVASGPGVSACLLAEEFGCEVVGVDLGELNVARARELAIERGVTDLVSFEVGDAEALPFPAGSFTAAVSECALCTFPNKDVALVELTRVVGPGGRVGITDVVVEHAALDEDLRDAAAWVACVAGAQGLPDYDRLLTRAGLEVTATERHDEAVARMLQQIEARLRVVAMLDADVIADVDLPRVRGLLARAADQARAGTIGYALLIATAA